MTANLIDGAGGGERMLKSQEHGGNEISKTLAAWTVRAAASELAKMPDGG